MRKLLLLGVLLSSLCIPCEAQQKMRDVFLQMPDSLFPYLTQNNRLDFIDFIDSGMKAVVSNEFSGKSEMLSLTDEELSLQLSSALKVKMRLMPVNEVVDSCHQVICVVKTYGEANPESKIEIYSISWQPLDVSKYLTLPHEPYWADIVEIPSLGLSLRQMNTLDAIAYEEQKMEEPWLKNIEWRR